MALRTDVVRLESMMTTRRTRSFAALAAASALALSACGGDSDTEGSSSSTSSSAESSASSSEGSESPSESASESPSESESAEGESGGEGSVTASKSGVTFDVPRGEIFGLLGPNGAGKSTLMKIISGQYSADHGTVTVGDATLTPGNTKDAVRHGVAIVPQELASIENMSEEYTSEKS